ncbi:hypothetical protein [uncultured Aquimarina sp.]|uniref:hypothetical protein n=1 Tax=uncultured Aquimarina sp. TaxID=575652 RepID=UPI0026383F67|nr:hypothetical protein [uncultured Aquimarina sp.]
MESEFRDKVKEYLTKLNIEIEDVIKKLISFEYPNEVISLDFEVFSDGFTENFPVRVFFMDKENCEFFIYNNNKAEYPSPVDPGLLNIHCVYNYEFLQKFEKHDENFDSWGIATDELIKWFIIRWLNSGGEKFKLNASIKAHHLCDKFDLIEQKWVEA